jgi:hypothetical protein
MGRYFAFTNRGFHTHGAHFLALEARIWGQREVLVRTIGTPGDP